MATARIRMPVTASPQAASRRGGQGGGRGADLAHDPAQGTGERAQDRVVPGAGLPLLEGHDAVDAAVDEGAGAVEVGRVVAQAVEHTEASTAASVARLEYQLPSFDASPSGVQIASAPSPTGGVRPGPRSGAARRARRNGARSRWGSAALAGPQGKGDALAHLMAARSASGAPEHQASPLAVPFDREVERPPGCRGPRLAKRDLGLAGGLHEGAVGPALEGDMGQHGAQECGARGIGAEVRGRVVDHVSPLSASPLASPRHSRPVWTARPHLAIGRTSCIAMRNSNPERW
jgi:hypothetical protein